VISSGYVEAGDTGRHRARSGDVVLHQPFEYHLDRVELSGSEVLVIPLAYGGVNYALGRIADPDTLVKAVESDPATAERALLGQLVRRSEVALDWPDDLALTLRRNPSLSLRDWAHESSLSVGSVSRGFAQVYGISASSYRLLRRTHRAIRKILETDESFTEIAQNSGFADQAHMSRAVRRATTISPKCLRVRWRR
jgi:AraC-like DNA-binding protein